MATSEHARGIYRHMIASGHIVYYQASQVEGYPAILLDFESEGRTMTLETTAAEARLAALKLLEMADVAEEMAARYRDSQSH
ncbi:MULTISPECIES: hypothetical protein [Nocardia]|uniref:hypothetical protein n=1 Tax=Nocardia TaxID=1817 RepID=UPI0013009ED2|nr:MULTISPECIES: hypothetical protein [Nocardia]